MRGTDEDLTDEQDQRLEAALETVEVYPLLCAVAHLTGDYELLREDLALDQGQLLVPGHGLTPEQEAQARQLAGDALRAHARARPRHGCRLVDRLRVIRFDDTGRFLRPVVAHLEP